MSKRQEPKSRHLYIHIPFCDHICGYCDFPKMLYEGKRAHDYVQKLLEELKIYGISFNSLETIYLGGGTPTSLDIADMELLLASLCPYLEDDCEFTVEANIENFTLEKGRLFQKYGVNRLSFGVQSLNDMLLEEMGRFHTRRDIVERISLAKGLGFENINVDLIFGLPSQTLAMFEEDLHGIVELDVDHVSTYGLSISPNTVFHNRNIHQLPQEQDRQFYDLSLQILRDNGYERYEVSNFARKGKRSRHNMAYWRNEHYYGIGLGAHGYLGEVRYANTKNLRKYLENEFVSERETVNAEDRLTYEFMLKLRTDEGMNHEDFFAKFHKKFDIDYKEAYENMLDSGLIEDDGTRIRATDEGICLLDTVILKFIG